MDSHVANAEPPLDALRLAAEDNTTEKVRSPKSSIHYQDSSETKEKSEEDEGKGGLGVYFVSEP